MSAAPLSYLTSAGTRADATLALTWFTLILSILVCVVTAVLLWIAVRRAVANGGAAATAAQPVERGGNGLRWISVGLAISAVPLLATLVWTMAALAQVAGPPAHPGLVLDVSAHQWWWGVTYDGASPSDRFDTANEIHIPVDVPVLLRLTGSDVIHSFWVPRLSGKTDAIPGQRNETWLQADTPGRYRGQCAEFCGWQHAKMAFEVVAEPQAAFDRWRARQRQTAPPPATPEQARGAALIAERCSRCHAVRGIEAGVLHGPVKGPDLTHLMSRRMIAAGLLPNNPGSLSGWIQDPQSVKPGALMPRQHLSAQQLNDVRAYLETLS